MRTRVKKNGYARFSERLKFIFETVAGQSEFINRTGFTEKRVDQLLNDDDPKVSELNKILQCYPLIMEKWLLTGNGVPVKDDPENFKKLSDFTDICERFRRERLDHDYTQEEWGKIFNRARATIAAIETGRQVFPFDVVRIWRSKFGKSYDYIIDGEADDLAVPKLLDKIDNLEQVIKDLRKDKEFLRKMLDKE